jgi:bifunctional enzyme CysN/CysC
MRHARLAWLLGIRRIVFAINKMDLLDMRQEAFETIRRQCLQMAHALTGCQTDFLPLSALFGDNVVSASARLAWFRGPTLLEYLETIPIDPGPARAPFRYPIQAVIDGAYAGQIASGSVAPGDEVMLLPGRDRARVVSLPAYGGDLARAGAPMSIAIRLDGKHNIGRGDMLVDPNDPPQTAWTIRATLVWFGYGSLTSGRRFLLKHTTQQIRAEVKEIHSPGQLAAGLGPNDIGAVTIETERPLFCDTYEVNRRTGSFIMIDSESSQTLGVGLIRGATETTTQNRGCAIWLTGLSSAGKTTLSRALCQRLSARGLRVEMLDGDEIRRELWPDLGFSKRDRDENIHRLGFLAGMLARNGVVAIVAAISPYRAARQEARRQVASFVEVYVNAPLETCQQRDVKGLYRKVRDGEIRGVTGVDDPYEAPEAPEVECRTDRETVAESLEKIMQYIEPWMK